MSTSPNTVLQTAFKPLLPTAATLLLITALYYTYHTTQNNSTPAFTNAPTTVHTSSAIQSTWFHFSSTPSLHFNTTAKPASKSQIDLLSSTTLNYLHKPSPELLKEIQTQTDSILSELITHKTNDFPTSTQTDYQSIANLSQLTHTLAALSDSLSPPQTASFLNYLNTEIIPPFTTSLQTYQTAKLSHETSPYFWLELQTSEAISASFSLLFSLCQAPISSSDKANFQAHANSLVETYLNNCKDGVPQKGIKEWLQTAPPLLILCEYLTAETPFKPYSNPKFIPFLQFHENQLIHSDITNNTSFDIYPIDPHTPSRIQRTQTVNALLQLINFRFNTAYKIIPASPEIPLHFLDLTQTLPTTRSATIPKHDHPPIIANNSSGQYILTTNKSPLILATQGISAPNAGSYTLFYNGLPIMGSQGQSFNPPLNQPSLLNSAYYQPIPVPNGYLQTLTQTTARHSFTTNENSHTVTYDLTPTYNAPILKKLVRTITYHRTGHAIATINDTFEAIQPITFQTQIILQGINSFTNHNIQLEDFIITTSTNATLKPSRYIRETNYHNTPIQRFSLEITQPALTGSLIYTISRNQ